MHSFLDKIKKIDFFIPVILFLELLLLFLINGGFDNNKNQMQGDIFLLGMFASILGTIFLNSLFYLAFKIFSKFLFKGKVAQNCNRLANAFIKVDLVIIVILAILISLTFISVQIFFILTQYNIIKI